MFVNQVDHLLTFVYSLCILSFFVLQPPRLEINKKWNDAIFHILILILVVMLTVTSHENVAAQQKQQMGRLAKLEIDSAQIEAYKGALKKEIVTSLRVEPGVLTLYAVSEKNNPTHITILEIYADTAASKAHLQTPHFVKYKTITRDMVRSLELVETIPVVPDLKVKSN